MYTHIGPNYIVCSRIFIFQPIHMTRLIKYQVLGLSVLEHSGLIEQYQYSVLIL
jgi:hypothetical protein